MVEQKNYYWNSNLNVKQKLKDKNIMCANYGRIEKLLLEFDLKCQKQN